MPGLVDIARSFKTVKVGDLEIPITGVSAEGIAYLLNRFPVVRQIIGGKAEDVTPDALMAMAPEVVAAILACGTGAINNPEAEAAARTLGVESQLNLLQAIITETMPGGVGPFVERALSLFKGLGVEFTNTADGTSPSPSKP